MIDDIPLVRLHSLTSCIVYFPVILFLQLKTEYPWLPGEKPVEDQTSVISLAHHLIWTPSNTQPVLPRFSLSTSILSIAPLEVYQLQGSTHFMIVVNLFQIQLMNPRIWAKWMQGAHVTIYTRLKYFHTVEHHVLFHNGKGMKHRTLVTLDTKFAFYGIKKTPLCSWWGNTSLFSSLLRIPLCVSEQCPLINRNTFISTKTGTRLQAGWGNT